MTAPTYRLYTHRDVHRVRALRWAWEVTDGLGGPLLLSGYARTEAFARAAAVIASVTIRSWDDVMRERLAQAVARLHDAGIDVEATLTRDGRVCVMPLCACSTRDEVRVLAAFLAITANVGWEVA